MLDLGYVLAEFVGDLLADGAPLAHQRSVEKENFLLGFLALEIAADEPGSAATAEFGELLAAFLEDAFRGVEISDKRKDSAFLDAQPFLAEPCSPGLDVLFNSPPELRVQLPPGDCSRAGDAAFLRDLLVGQLALRHQLGGFLPLGVPNPFGHFSADFMIRAWCRSLPQVGSGMSISSAARSSRASWTSSRPKVETSWSPRSLSTMRRM